MKTVCAMMMMMMMVVVVALVATARASVHVDDAGRAAAVAAVERAAATTKKKAAAVAPANDDERTPLVSVVIPTYKRPTFLLNTVEKVLREQTYTNVEVVIVDDSPECLTRADFDTLLGGERSLLDKIVYHCEAGGARMSIGAKRNAAIAASRGRIVMLWDDDDVFAPTRIAVQVRDLLDNAYDMNALEFSYILSLHAEPPTLFAVVSPDTWGPHFATVAFRRELFDSASIRFPDTSFAEDYTFVERALGEANCRFNIITEQQWVYLKHDNTVKEFTFDSMQRELRTVPDAAWPAWFTAADRDFFVAMAELRRGVNPDDRDIVRRHEQNDADAAQKRTAAAKLDAATQAASSATAETDARKRQYKRDVTAELDSRKRQYKRDVTAELDARKRQYKRDVTAELDTRKRQYKRDVTAELDSRKRQYKRDVTTELDSRKRQYKRDVTAAVDAEPRHERATLRAPVERIALNTVAGGAPARRR